MWMMEGSPATTWNCAGRRVGGSSRCAPSAESRTRRENGCFQQMARDGLSHKWTGIIGTVLQEKWEKMQLLVEELADMVKEALTIQEQECKAAGCTRTQMIKTGDFSEKAKFSRQRLLEIQRFLNYVVRKYDWMTPYMKGLHNTIDGWQFDRDSRGWKMKRTHLQAMLVERFCMSELCREGTEGYEGTATPKSGLKGSSKEDSEEPPRVQPVERLLSIS